jgi:hypothetical protein
MGRRGQIIFLLLLAAGGAIGWVKYQEYSAQKAAEQARKQARERALIGDRVLKIPPALTMDSPDQLYANSKCKGMGISLRKESKNCSGEGELFGIPGIVDVERLNDGQLHQVTYSFALPARKRLTASLSNAFGPARTLDMTKNDRGLCWPLPDKQEIVMEWDEHDDSDSGVAIFINSQVAAQVLQWAEARPHACSDVLPASPRE